MKIKAWSPAQLGKAPLNLFLYVRVSMGRDVMDSPESQINAGELTAKLRNAGIKQIVRDIDESGRDFHARHVAWMIEEIRKGAANGVIVLETSRWGRNLTESRRHVQELYAAGGVLISTAQPIDPTTADGLMIMNHFMNMDEHQGNKLGEGWVRAHAGTRKKGRPHHGREVFGYRRCDECKRSEKNSRAYEHCPACKGVLQPNEDVAPHYSKAFERYNAGVSMRTIVRDMRAIGITTVKGKELSSSGLRASMDTGFAAGFIRVNDPNADSRSAGPWDWEKWPRGKHKAIISLETWKRYVQRREQQRNPGARMLFPSHPLSTLLRCGRELQNGEICHASMHANPSKTKVNTFRCASSTLVTGCPGVTISMPRAESLVLDWIERHANRDGVDEIIARHDEQAQDDLNELKKVETRERELKKKIDNLVDAVMDGVLTRDEVRTRKDVVEGDLRAVQAKLAMLREAVVSTTAPPREAFMQFLDLWPDYTVEEKQRSLRLIIDHIVVRRTPVQKPNEIEIVPRWAPLDRRLEVRQKNWDRLRALAPLSE
ncbi:recombinase family protein [Streptomyces sp. NBC_00470]|uniref:recombinase family protein n=1 Tax=Streptomyces sp. NBC_00470 TaxID=2975753 RepID=UPI0030E27CD4